jgi:hypothetical protein
VQFDRVVGDICLTCSHTQTSGGAGNRTEREGTEEYQNGAIDAIETTPKGATECESDTRIPPTDESGTIRDTARARLLKALADAVREGLADGDVVLASAATDAIVRLLPLARSAVADLSSKRVR